MFFYQLSRKNETSEHVRIFRIELYVYGNEREVDFKMQQIIMHNQRWWMCAYERKGSPMPDFFEFRADVC